MKELKMRIIKLWLILFYFILLSACVSYNSNISPISPEDGQQVDSLRPTLSWSSIEGASYELAVYNKTKEAVNPTYHRDDLNESVHILEEDLDPTTEYSWTVRYHLDGVTSEWVKRELVVFTGVSAHTRTRFLEFKTP